MDKNRALVINGSARANSNTEKAVKALCPFQNYETINLFELEIEHYNYSESATDDDFWAVTKKLQLYDEIVFATPVYWYSMSGRMKVFFDRLTDIISLRKDIGRSLKNKNTYLICTGSDAAVPVGFEVPFKRTSEYLEMNFKGCFYLLEDHSAFTVLKSC